jgi:hypothetical protein
MTRVVIVGEIYNADLSIGGGPIYPPPGSPSHPWVPPSPPGYWGGVAPPTPTHPIAPGGQPPGYWGGAAPPYPDQGLPGQPPGYWGGVAPPVPPHPWVPPAGQEIPPPPPEIAHNVVVAVWSPTSQQWSVRIGEPAPAPGA